MTQKTDGMVCYDSCWGEGWTQEGRMLGSSWRCGRREGRGSIGAMSERADLEENIARYKEQKENIGRRAQGTHGPKGRAPKGAEREAPKAPSVPADVLRGTGFRAHKPTSAAQAQHKPSTSPGTSPEETNSFTDIKKYYFLFFFVLELEI